MTAWRGTPLSFRACRRSLCRSAAEREWVCAMAAAATARGAIGREEGGREEGVWMWLLGRKVVEGRKEEEEEEDGGEEEAFSWSMAARCGRKGGGREG